MVQRYLKLLEFLDFEDDAIMEVMPTPAAIKRLRTLFKDLKDIESVSKSLQGSDVDLLDVRQWFDELIAVKPHYNAYLGTLWPRANIVHSSDFEAGCVRVLRGRQDPLTRAEKAALLPFAKAVDNEDITDDEGLFFDERIRKRRRLEQSKVTSGMGSFHRHWR
uniref:Uncharacterized protein n=1 Tax=Phytophthora ramorum TaxID=164328 RepID=H3GIA9_PHYRM